MWNLWYVPLPWHFSHLWMISKLICFDLWWMGTHMHHIRLGSLPLAMPCDISHTFLLCDWCHNLKGWGRNFSLLCRFSLFICILLFDALVLKNSSKQCKKHQKEMSLASRKGIAWASAPKGMFSSDLSYLTLVQTFVQLLLQQLWSFMQYSSFGQHPRDTAISSDHFSFGGFFVGVCFTVFEYALGIPVTSCAWSWLVLPWGRLL